MKRRADARSRVAETKGDKAVFGAGRPAESNVLLDDSWFLRLVHVPRRTNAGRLSGTSTAGRRRLGDLPVLAALVAVVVLWRSWQLDTDLRAEVHVAVSVEWRVFRRPTVWLSAGVIVIGMDAGVGIFTHGIAG